MTSKKILGKAKIGGGPTSSEEDVFSISSSLIRQRKDSTIFHKVKEKFTNPSLKESNVDQELKEKSILSNGLFKIPEED